MTAPATAQPSRPWRARARGFDLRKHLVPVVAVLVASGYGAALVAGKVVGEPRKAVAEAQEASDARSAAVARKAASEALAAVPTTAPATTVPFDPLTPLLSYPLHPAARQLIGFAPGQSALRAADLALNPASATEVARQILQMRGVDECDMTIRLVETGPRGSERQRIVDPPIERGHPVIGQQLLVDCAPKSAGRGVPIPTVTTQAGAS